MKIQPKLTTFDTTMIVVSLVVGTGIFRTPSTIANFTQTSGLFLWTWVIGGLISLCGALTFAEIGARYSVPGGAYKVVGYCYHPVISFMLNWLYVLSLAVTITGVAISGAEYFVKVVFPMQLQNRSTVLIIVVIMILSLSAINYAGVKTGSKLTNFLTVSKILMILMIIVLPLFFIYIIPGRISAPLIESKIDPNFNYLKALGIGLVPVFFTYAGFHDTINLGGDVINAKKNLPRAILTGFLIIISIYLLTNFTYLQALGIEGIKKNPLVAGAVLKVLFGNTGLSIISIAIFISILGYMSVQIMQAPRMYYAMAEDKILPPFFKKVNPKTQVQEVALLFFTGVALLSLLFLGSFEKIVNYVMFVNAFSQPVQASTVFVLRRRAKRDGIINDSYKVPLYPLVPILFIVFYFSIAISIAINDPITALSATLLLLCGYPLFYLLRKLYPEMKENSN